jgi:hypothetical protein
LIRKIAVRPGIKFPLQCVHIRSRSDLENSVEEVSFENKESKEKRISANFFHCDVESHQDDPYGIEISIQFD